MVELMKVTMNQRSQRGLAQLGTVKNSSRQRGQAVTHFTLLQTPAAGRAEGGSQSVSHPIKQTNNQSHNQPTKQ